MRQRKSDLIHSLTGELGRVTSGTYLFLQFVASLVFTAMQIAIAFFISYQMTLFVLVCGLIIMLMSRKYIAQSRKLGTTAMDLAQSYLAGITDYFNGIKDVKSNQLERSRYIWLKEWSENSARERYENARVRGNSQLLYKTTSTLIIALFIYVSVMLFQGQSGYLLLVIAIFARLWPRFTTLQSNLEQIASAIPSFKALMKLQADCHAAKELNVEARQLPNAYDEENILRRELECRDVSFRYNKDQQQLTLHHISVRIAANEMTAIVGPSGAGKSTLVDLMMGLMEPEEGEVYLDGMPLTAAGRIAMRGLVSYVPQDPFLFHGSIRDNMLLIDPQASDQDIWEALRFSSAAEFVGRLPDGLDTVIGDRGIRLSGGERQRLVLARSILRRPSILILDEATSALDMDNELRIQKALEKLKGMMTIIVIAHRLSTVRNADQVIVLEHGHIVQSGEFDKLSEDKKGLFSRLLGSQLFIA